MSYVLELLALIIWLCTPAERAVVEQALAHRPDLIPYVHVVEFVPCAGLRWNVTHGRAAQCAGAPGVRAAAEAEFGTGTIRFARDLPGALSAPYVIHEACHLQAWRLFADPSEAAATRCERR